jgi:uncharacterized membrane protein YheB (UPF0754 family)
MSVTLSGLLAWIAPPVVGAAIGWVTNDIAIRMLFRPLRPVRVLGMRLPLTPGIIPKERRSLAVNIGRMVSRELITEEALRSQIHDPRTLAALSESVAKASGDILARQLGSLATGAEALLPSTLETLLDRAFSRAAGSPAFSTLVSDLAARAVATLAGIRISEVAARVDLARLLETRLLPGLAGKGAGAGRAVAGFVADRAADLLSDETLSAAARMLEPLLPDAVERLAAWVDGDETRAAIGREARAIIAAAVEQLSTVQRLIVGVGQFERRLDERMPGIVDEVVAAVGRLARSPSNQARLLDAAAGGLRDWRDRLAGDPRRAAALADAVSGAFERLAGGLADPERRRRLAEDLAGRLSQSDGTVGGLARSLLGVSEAEAAEMAASRALAWLSRKGSVERVSGSVAGMARRFVEENAEVPLGRLLGVDEQKKTGLDAFLTDRLVGLVDAKLPEILRGVDVEDLVVRKIDALDVRDVERLLMQVLAPHLKWINVFGAILGALIGFVQVVLRLLVP